MQALQRYIYTKFLISFCTPTPTKKKEKKDTLNYTDAGYLICINSQKQCVTSSLSDTRGPSAWAVPLTNLEVGGVRGGQQSLKPPLLSLVYKKLLECQTEH